jgi:hypothetical protein
MWCICISWRMSVFNLLSGWNIFIRFVSDNPRYVISYVMDDCLWDTKKIKIKWQPICLQLWFDLVPAMDR